MKYLIDKTEGVVDATPEDMGQSYFVKCKNDI